MSTTQSDRLTIVRAIKEGSFSNRIALILSVWFGAGLLPVMPGTYATIAAIPLYALGNFLAPQYQVSILVLITIGAIWSSHRSQRALGVGDSPQIVIDEVAGFLLTIVCIPFTWLALVAGFFLCRFFDILKPPPIRWIERVLKGGMAVVLDDLVAAVYAHISLRVVLYLFT